MRTSESFTRETKIFLVVAFAAVLGVSILFVDHFAAGKRADPATADDLAAGVTNSARDAPQNDLIQPIRDIWSKTREETDRIAADLNNFREENRPEPAIELGPLNPDPELSPDGDSLEMGKPTTSDSDGRIAQPADLRTHRVVQGDTLWSLAQRYYGDPQLHDELAAYNRDRLSANLQPRHGVTLLIPVRDQLGSASSNTAVSRPVSRPKPAPTPVAARTTYTVAKGDTLSQISSRLLGTSKRWQEILDLNSDILPSANKLRPGMKLTIPAR